VGAVPAGAKRRRAAISKKVFVGNLSFDVTREELVETFKAAGAVVDAKIPTDRESGRPRGFAFVEFDSDESAQRAIALLHGKDLKGRPLRVNEAESRPPRPLGAGPRPTTGGPRSMGGGLGRPVGGGFAPPPLFPPDTPHERGQRRGRPLKKYRDSEGEFGQKPAGRTGKAEAAKRLPKRLKNVTDYDDIDDEF
jgi:cold-inducible RNA-binding protein